MYDYENNSQNAGGSASDSGTENSMGTSSEYRYSGPFLFRLQLQL